MLTCYTQDGSTYFNLTKRLEVVAHKTEVKGTIETNYLSVKTSHEESNITSSVSREVS